MAEFNFYAIADEVEAIFCSLSERGDLRFIPERSYPTAEYTVLKGVRTEAERSLSQNRSWFIMGSFTKLRPETRKIADNHYSVWGHFDGSLLRLITPPLNRVENGVRELVSGSLSHPRTNWNEDQRQMERVPDEVRIAYADIVKTIKLHLIRKKFGKNVWIGEKAAKLIADGKAQILVDGKWWDGEGNTFYRPNIARSGK
jgi:hypothetical protein